MDGLKQKQRKLLYHFGETIYELYRAECIDFTFPSGNEALEKETSKLLKLLNYMDERIQKFEQADPREETVPAGEASVPEVKAPVAEESAESPAVVVHSEEAPLAEKQTEGVSESPEEEGEELRWEESGSTENDESSSTAPIAAESESAPEILSEGSSNASFAEVPEEETIFVPEPEAFVPETPVPEETPAQGTDALTFQGLLDGVRFKSEIERRVFEDNLGVLQAGDEKDRVRALKNISRLGGKETFKDVCNLAMKDTDPAVRSTAIKLIGRTRDPESAGLFRAGLQDRDAGVRIASVKGLSMLLLKDCVPSIESMLQDPDAHVRGMTVTYLGIYGGAEGIRLASEACKDPDSFVRKSLVDVLAIVRAPGTISVVKQLLDDPDDGVRRSAANALSKSKAVETKG